MQLEIITPEKSVFSGEAKAVKLPGIGGSFGVLDNHAPLISALKEGKVKVTDDAGKEQLFDVKGGVIEVLNNKVIILAE